MQGWKRPQPGYCTWHACPAPKELHHEAHTKKGNFPDIINCQINFCNKTTQSSKKMIQNNLQIMIMAMLNGMMIFDFIVQFILFYCQYLHIRPCFHNVTTMRFKHSILFLRPPISPQNPGKTVTTKEKGSSSNLSYGILIHPISQTLPKRSKLLNSGFILQTRSKAFTVHTSASLIFQ